MSEILLNYLDIFMGWVGMCYEPVSLSVIIFVILFDRKQLNIKLDGVSKFISLLAILFFFRMAMWGGQQVSVTGYGFKIHDFLFVFLEDVFYVMVPYYICRRLKSTTAIFFVWAFFSFSFGYAHLYQGWKAVYFLSIYPFFISYRYAKRSTFGTVMACHFLYDCFVYTAPRLNNLLNLE